MMGFLLLKLLCSIFCIYNIDCIDELHFSIRLVYIDTIFSFKDSLATVSLLFVSEGKL